MANPAEYTAVANAILKIINGEIATAVPGWAQSMIPSDMAPTLAGKCAKVAVDTLDAFRATENKVPQ